MNREDREIIKFENVSFSYNTHRVLSDAGFLIKEREIISIVGPNGGGKTTLLRLMLGFLKPQAGRITVKGKPPESSQKIMGYVPQHISLDRKFPVTVKDVVLSGRIKPFGLYSRKDHLIAEEAIEAMELKDLKKERFSEISGGQIQRMFIARAIVSEAEILLLDEPTSNIDSPSQNRLNSILKGLNEKMTIIIVTHDTGFVSNITDRVLCINTNVVEHPLDSNFSQLVSSSYSNQPLLVRHDKQVSENSHKGSNK